MRLRMVVAGLLLGLVGCGDDDARTVTRTVTSPSPDTSSATETVRQPQTARSDADAVRDVYMAYFQ
ncbi:MAG: hypothetical protein LC777_02920, partial [Actinobacteria bacterium]|nr:hypothetical protein [Actinomycetota bacterium]